MINPRSSKEPHNSLIAKKPITEGGQDKGVEVANSHQRSIGEDCESTTPRQLGQIGNVVYNGKMIILSADQSCDAAEKIT